MGEAAGLAAAFIGALQSIFISSLARRVPVWVINATTGIFVSLFYGIALLASGQADDLWHAPILIVGLTALSGVLGFTVGFTMNAMGLKLAGVARALPTQMSAYTVFTLIMAFLLLNEDITWLTALGLGFILVGVYAVSEAGRKGPSVTAAETGKRLGLALALGSGLIGAMATFIIKMALEDLPVVTVNFIRFPSGVLSLIALASVLPTGYHPTRYGRQALAIMAAVGFVGFGLGSFSFTYAVGHAGAAKTAILISTTPLFALPMSLLILKEKITARLVTGTVLSILGIILVV
ncbi:MAG: DMT family transporter [Chloroflexi bacterium]|nr:DMT family transporter [Chloroflexota bacterium]